MNARHFFLQHTVLLAGLYTGLHEAVHRERDPLCRISLIIGNVGFHPYPPELLQRQLRDSRDAITENVVKYITRIYKEQIPQNTEGIVHGPNRTCFTFIS